MQCLYKKILEKNFRKFLGKMDPYVIHLGKMGSTLFIIKQ